MEEELDQNKQHGIIVMTETDNFKLKGRPCELSAFSFVPTERHDPPQRTVYNSRKPENPNSTYDRLFRKQIGYNNKLHRDDREHAKSRGLIVNEEEKIKPVPTLSSSIYGHDLETELDPPDRKHVRIAHVKAEFYRRNGTGAS
ncbi:cilia- and flagella-associated protein 90-like isoform X2 [Ruditapes philippinarum]|uniref:cilia- and flagella-associated protein 90-like isoform X2 n=1 Tax=Ruditapes philippinarum TaxID=129788 RepID=UPI00295A7EDD|nr:cilia- and flagella-associated protein 90-like isoform X2 [Ruditapes philippinarum]